jgi:hypothetical protein
MAPGGLAGEKSNNLSAGGAKYCVCYKQHMDMNTGKIIRLLFWCQLGLLFPVLLSAQQAGQEVFTLVGGSVIEGNNMVELHLKALDGNQPMNMEQVRKRFNQISEQLEGKPFKVFNVPQNHPNVQERVKKEKNNAAAETAQILFLLDQSSAMDQAAIDRGKALIQQIAGGLNLSAQSRIFVASFGSQTGTPVWIVDKNNLGTQLAAIQPSGGKPDLHKALVSGLEHLKLTSEKKVLFILSNGSNAIEGNPAYQSGAIPYTETDVLDLIRPDDDRLLIIPIALGTAPQTGLFQRMTEQTPQQADRVQIAEIPDNLNDMLHGDSVIVYTHVVLTPTKFPVFTGEKRTYQLLSDGKTAATYTRQQGWGKLSAPIVLSNRDLGLWILVAVLGIAILVGLLAIFAFTVPALQRSEFKKKYVKAYKAEAGRRHTDPLTLEPIQDGELVVTRCSQIVPLRTWDGLGRQCPNHPDCMQNRLINCNGAGGPENTNNFFSLQGAFRRLNWLWFGAAGGFVGWLVFAMFKWLSFDGYKQLMGKIYTRLEAIGRPGAEAVDSGLLAENAMVGIAFGFGLVTMLAQVEERTQGRGVSQWRVALRAGLGVLLSALIFIFGFFLYFERIVPMLFLSEILTWVLFGLAVGLVLSINSSIVLSKGLMGGGLAGLLGFIIYVGIGKLTDNFIMAKLIGLMAQGAVLGWVVVTVVNRFEDFELEYVSPPEFRRVVPISKWLKSGMEVVIGTEQGSYVYVKWKDDEALARHAELRYENGAVVITALGETTVSGVLLQPGKKRHLQNGDIIQLGRNGRSRFKFKTKSGTVERPVHTATSNDKGRLDMRIGNK